VGPQMGPHEQLHLLQDDKADNIVSANPQKVRCEPIIESEGPFALEGFHDAVQHAVVVDSLVHHPRLDYVKGRPEASGREPSSKRTDEVERHGVGNSRVLKHHLLVLVVAGDLSGVDRGVSHDVGYDANPKPSDPIHGHSLLITVPGSIVLDLRGVSAPALGLQTDLNDVSGVGNCDSDGPREHPSHDLNTQGWILAWLHISCNQIPYG